jgi:hypothetical protein
MLPVVLRRNVTALLIWSALVSRAVLRKVQSVVLVLFLVLTYSTSNMLYRYFYGLAISNAP